MLICPSEEKTTHPCFSVQNKIRLVNAQAGFVVAMHPGYLKINQFHRNVDIIGVWSFNSLLKLKRLKKKPSCTCIKTTFLSKWRKGKKKKKKTRGRRKHRQMEEHSLFVTVHSFQLSKYPQQHRPHRLNMVSGTILACIHLGQIFY